MKIAIVPGSFDPVTRGHIDVIDRAARLFDRVIVAAMVNEQKMYLFTQEERVALLRAETSGLANVEVCFHGGMLWQLARDVGACAIVKGVRNARDAEYELAMAAYNAERCPTAQTLLLPASEGLDGVSSTAAREGALRGEDVSQLVGPETGRALREKYEKENEYGSKHNG